MREIKLTQGKVACAESCPTKPKPPATRRARSVKRWTVGSRVRCACHGEEYVVERAHDDLVLLSDGEHHGPLLRVSQTKVTWTRATRAKRKGKR